MLHFVLVWLVCTGADDITEELTSKKRRKKITRSGKKKRKKSESFSHRVRKWAYNCNGAGFSL